METGKLKLNRIEVDLFNFEISLFFSNAGGPLSLLFDKPARRFYFAVIALVIREMQKRNKGDYLWIRGFQTILQDLDKKISGELASKNTEAMWGKIRKAWRERLIDLRKGSLFKVVDRDRIIPGGETGGHIEYDCSEEEADIWSKLIAYDWESSRNWHYKFAADKVGLPLDQIILIYKDRRGEEAWSRFIQNLPYLLTPPSEERHADSDYFLQTDSQRLNRLIYLKKKSLRLCVGNSLGS